MAAADASPRPGLHLLRRGCWPGGPAAAGIAFDGTAPTGVGYSAVISPRGEVVRSLGAEPGLLVADLDLDVVEQTRAAIPVLANRRFERDPRQESNQSEPLDTSGMPPAGSRAAARRRSERRRSFLRERRRRRRTPSAIRSDQDCAPLSWTSERAGTLFACERDEEGSGEQAQSSASGASNQTRSEP